jgi:hypothetical protein
MRIGLVGNVWAEAAPASATAPNIANPNAARLAQCAPNAHLNAI